MLKPHYNSCSVHNSLQSVQSNRKFFDRTHYCVTASQKIDTEFSTHAVRSGLKTGPIIYTDLFYEIYTEDFTNELKLEPAHILDY